MKITLAQVAPKLNKSNLADTKDIVSNIDSDIVVFPELSLNGYMLMDAVYDNCYSVDELDELKELSVSKDIVVGVALKVDNKIYNSAIYFSDGDIKHIHHKNYLPNYGMFEEARYFFASDSMECFDTKYGKAMMVVCEDMWSANTLDIISKNSPDIVYVLTASPTRDFLDDGKLLIEDKWSAILKSASILSGANIVFVNRVGFEDGVGFWGGSMLIGANSQVSHQLPLFEESISTIEIDKNLSKTQKYMLRHK
jgi:predicted amidohydrolase